jgi:hypothetical protein
MLLKSGRCFASRFGLVLAIGEFFAFPFEAAARHRQPTVTPLPAPTATLTPPPAPTATPRPTATPAGQSFVDSFDVAEVIEETGSITESGDPDWWVNSGGRFIKSGGLGHTLQGELPATDRWRVAYSQSNPVDTDDGYHPQNIFRLVTRTSWTNLDQQVHFRIDKINPSASPNRNASNGVLLFNRYQDGQTLYYTGVRVDGAAVIKKKLAGTYTTLAYGAFFPGFGSYDPTTKPNLIPENQWIGIRSVVNTNPDSSVDIQLFVDDGSGWQLALDAVDTGTTSAAIVNGGYGGIRTDFLDADFEDYQMTAR